MKTHLALALVVSSGATLMACSSDGTPCTDDIKPGPVRVSVDCVEEAKSDSDTLGQEPLVVEYRQGDDTWRLCNRQIIASDGIYTATSFTQQLCDSSLSLVPRFDCGRHEGTFEIRARQGARSAGPVEVSARRTKDGCHYTEKSLSYELSLDVEE